MSADVCQHAGMTIPKWLQVDLTPTEAAIIAVAVAACVSAVLELAQYLGVIG